MSNAIAEETDVTYCEGCGRRPGPLGCCEAISKLQLQLTTYELALKQISKSKDKTIRGECCEKGTCLPAAGAQCGFRAGANRAFVLAARGADFVLESNEQV